MIDAGFSRGGGWHCVCQWGRGAGAGTGFIPFFWVNSDPELLDRVAAQNAQATALRLRGGGGLEGSALRLQHVKLLKAQEACGVCCWRGASAASRA